MTRKKRQYAKRGKREKKKKEMMGVSVARDCALVVRWVVMIRHAHP